MLKRLPIFLVLPLLVAAQPARRGAWPARLVAAQVTGAQHFAPADVLAYAGLKIGADVSPQDFKSAADRLGASGAFQDVEFQYAPAGGGVKVEFRINEVPDLIPTSFDNFVWFTDEELLAAVRRRVPLFSHAVPAEGELLNEVIDALQAALAERDIPGEVRFTPEGESDHPPTSGIFSVEGITIRIAAVKLTGDGNGDAAIERAAVALRETPYRRASARAFVERDLRPVYEQRGYLKASFSEPVPQLVSDDPKAPAVALTIAVTPGAQYRLAEIRWSGNQAVQTYDLNKLISLAPGGIADASQLSKDLDAVHTLYSSHGYLRQSVRLNTAFNDAEHTVSYTIEVDEDEPYHMGSVEIIGLPTPLRDRVREVWKLREGEPFDATYYQHFLKDAAALLPASAVTHVEPSIDENSKTVDVTIHYNFQQRAN